jgi:chromosome segregation ATPase
MQQSTSGLELKKRGRERKASTLTRRDQNLAESLATQLEETLVALGKKDEEVHIAADYGMQLMEKLDESAGHIEKLEKLLESEHAKRVKAKALKAKYKREAQVSALTLDDLQHEVETLRARNAELEPKFATVSAECAQAQERVSELEESVKDHSTRADKLKAQLEDAIFSKETLEGELWRLRDAQKSSKSGTDDATNTTAVPVPDPDAVGVESDIKTQNSAPDIADATAAELAGLHESVAELKSQLASVRAAHAQAKNELDRARADAARSRKDISSLERRASQVSQAPPVEDVTMTGAGGIFRSNKEAPPAMAAVWVLSIVMGIAVSIVGFVGLYDEHSDMVEGTGVYMLLSGVIYALIARGFLTEAHEQFYAKYAGFTFSAFGRAFFTAM